MERTHSRESGFVLCPTPAIDPRRPERRPQMESGRSRFGPARDAHADKSGHLLAEDTTPEAGPSSPDRGRRDDAVTNLNRARTSGVAWSVNARRSNRSAVSALSRAQSGGWPLRPAPGRRVPPLGPSAGQPGTDGTCQRHGVRHGREDSAPSFTSQGRKAGPAVGCARPPGQRCRRCS